MLLTVTYKSATTIEGNVFLPVRDTNCNANAHGVTLHAQCLCCLACHYTVQMKEDGDSGQCSSIKRIQTRSDFRMSNLNGRDHLKDLGIDRMIILK
jgi:hypothetical protein